MITAIRFRHTNPLIWTVLDQYQIQSGQIAKLILSLDLGEPAHLTDEAQTEDDIV